MISLPLIAIANIFFFLSKSTGCPPPSSLKINVKGESGPQLARVQGMGIGWKKAQSSIGRVKRVNKTIYQVHVVGGGKSPGMIQENLYGLICH